MSSPQAARRRSNKTQPECIDHDDQQLETLTSRAVLKKGPGQTPSSLLPVAEREDAVAHARTLRLARQPLVDEGANDGLECTA